MKCQRRARWVRTCDLVTHTVTGALCSIVSGDSDGAMPSQKCSHEEYQKNLSPDQGRDTWESRNSSLKIDWLTTEGAAAFLKVSVGSIRNMSSNGEIPVYKLGRRNRYLASDLSSLLLASKKGVRNGN